MCIVSLSWEVGGRINWLRCVKEKGSNVKTLHMHLGVDVFCICEYIFRCSLTAAMSTISETFAHPLNFRMYCTVCSSVSLSL